MYWPIGAPRVYADSKHKIAAPALHDEGASGQGDNVGHAREQTGPQGRLSPGDTQESSRRPTGARSASNGTTTSKDYIVAAKLSRSGTVFATTTSTRLTVWQAKPAVALAAVVRSPKSLLAYGESCDLFLRPDGRLLVIQTTLGYLITYALISDPPSSVYQTVFPDGHRQARISGVDEHQRRLGSTALGPVSADGNTIREVELRFRMVIRIDAGISAALALDEELMVATQRPVALQCIGWAADKGRTQTSTELLSRMPWIVSGVSIIQMVYDRPMNLMCWVTSEGKVYAVQRKASRSDGGPSTEMAFHGFCFHDPRNQDASAVAVTVNARFSLIAVGRRDCQIDVYTVKDYTGNIPLSHPVRTRNSGQNPGMLQHLSYSPDGYCLLAGFEDGWSMWSVYGKGGANSFTADRVICSQNGEEWLEGLTNAFWLGGGCEVLFLNKHNDHLFVLNVARNVITGCMSPVNVSRGLLVSTDSVTFYKGQGITDLTSLSSDVDLWQTVPVPHAYVASNWPIKIAAISSDSRYVAVAGRRGLAHYSLTSGRWKTFDDPDKEQGFAVRGGMCWYQHHLIVAVESLGKYQLRLYSREKPLERTVYVEELRAPAILTSMSGHDSLLVYTSDNTLLHYIVTASATSAKLVQVGQIGFHGVIRAPQRVRSISWILPEDQLESGDPSQDVATAAVIFLVDGKLVLLQPSMNENGELKYDLRVVAQNVEYYVLTRDLPNAIKSLTAPGSNNGESNGLLTDSLYHSLRDSLWYFDGDSLQVWADVQDVLASAPNDLGRDIPTPVQISVDFYPMSVMVDKGIIHGLDPDLIQRRDVNFSYFRLAPRTQLFLPQLLRHHLEEFNSPSAVHLVSSYKHLPYFAHALEVLLHNVLDTEVDNPPFPPETALLPSVLSFLSSFDAYLDVIVNCTRKTELRSWRTLFSYLPPVQQLFEQALEQDKLKTAAGYLLVLHALEQEHEGYHVQKFARLLQRAAATHDWELCGEVARFLVGIDDSGRTLTTALAEAGLNREGQGSVSAQLMNGGSSDDLDATHVNGRSAGPSNDYFSVGGQR